MAAAQVYSEEKAQRLVRTFGATLSFSLLIGWFEIMILRPGIDMKVEMQHMDPSEIIGIPFPLTNVTVFTMLPVSVLMIFWTVVDPATVGWKLLSFIKVSGLIVVLFALCGNNLVDTWQHSITAALYLATLICTNLSEKRTSNILEELPFYDHSDLLATSRLYMTIAFLIPFSILSVLDHGHQNQRWPIPVLMGGTYGFVFGSLAGLFLAYFQAKKKEKK